MIRIDWLELSVYPGEGVGFEPTDDFSSEGGNRFYGVVWRNLMGVRVCGGPRNKNVAPYMVLLTGGVTKKIRCIDSYLRELFPGCVLKIARIDIAIDYHDDLETLGGKPVVSARSEVREFTVDGEYSGFACGVGDVRFRFYDKAREQKVEGPWWRYEVQVRGDAVRRMHRVWTTSVEAIYTYGVLLGSRIDGRKGSISLDMENGGVHPIQEMIGRHEVKRRTKKYQKRGIPQAVSRNAFDLRKNLVELRRMGYLLDNEVFGFLEILSERMVQKHGYCPITGVCG